VGTTQTETRLPLRFCRLGLLAGLDLVSLGELTPCGEDIRLSLR